MGDQQEFSEFPRVSTEASSGVKWTRERSDIDVPIDEAIRDAQRDSENGNQNIAEMKLIAALGIKPHHFSMADIYASRFEADFSFETRVEIFVLLTQTAEKTGNVQRALSIGKSLFGIPEHATARDWGKVLRQIENSDHSRELASSIAFWAMADHESLCEVNAIELILQVVDRVELARWSTLPSTFLATSHVSRACLSAYLQGLSINESVDSTDSLTEWLADKLQNKKALKRNDAKLIFCLSYYHCQRGRMLEGCRLIYLLARTSIPFPNSSGFLRPGVTDDIISELLLLWLEQQLDVKNESWRNVALQLGIFLERSTISGTRFRRRLLDLMIRSNSSPFPGAVNKSDLLDCLLRLDGTPFQHHSENSANTEISRLNFDLQPDDEVGRYNLEPQTEARMRKIHSYLNGESQRHNPAVSQAAGGESQATDSTNAVVQDQKIALSCIGTIAASDFVLSESDWNSNFILDPVKHGIRKDLSFDGFGSNSDTIVDILELRSCRKEEMIQSRGHRILDNRQLRDVLNRYRTDSQKTVVLLGFQPTSTQLLLYAIEATIAGGLQLHVHPLDNVNRNLAEVRRKISDFQDQQISIWQIAGETLAAPNVFLASELLELLKDFLEWSDRLLSEAVSDLLHRCSASPDVVINAQGIAQSLLLDLLTINARDGRRIPLFCYCNTIHWIPGIALQQRLNEGLNVFQQSSAAASNRMACAYLPIRKSEFGTGGFCGGVKGMHRSEAPDYLDYRFNRKNGSQSTNLKFMNKFCASALNDLAKGKVRDFVVLAHGCPEKGAILLWDELVDSFGSAPHFETLMLISCDMGRLDHGRDASSVSHSLMSNILRQGTVAQIGAFRYMVPDLIAVHFAMDLLQSDRQTLTPCIKGNNLASVRNGLLREAFAVPRTTDDSLVVSETCFMQKKVESEVANALRQWVAAVSIAYSGQTSQENDLC